MVTAPGFPGAVRRLFRRSGQEAFRANVRIVTRAFRQIPARFSR